MKRFTRFAVASLAVAFVSIVYAQSPAPPQNVRFVSRVPSGPEPTPCVIPPASGGEHAYFDELVRRPEHLCNWSLRSQAQLDSLVADPTSTYFQYVHGSDSYPQAQDAAKLLITPHNETNTWNIPGKQQLRAEVPNTVTGESGSLLITWDWWWGPEWRTNHGGVTGWKSWRLQNSGGPWWTLLHSLGPSGDSPDPLEVARVTSGFVKVGNKPEALESVDDAVFPSGPGTRPLLPRYDHVYPLRHSRWTRYWVEVQFRKLPSEFVDWNTAYCKPGAADNPCTGAGGTQIAGNPGEPQGRWHMLSMWVADRERGVQRILYRVPMNWTVENGQNGRINSFDFEMNTSKTDAIGDAIAYGRNLVFLYNYTLPAANPESDKVIFRTP